MFIITERENIVVEKCWHPQSPVHVAVHVSSKRSPQRWRVWIHLIFNRKSVSRNTTHLQPCNLIQVEPFAYFCFTFEKNRGLLSASVLHESQIWRKSPSRRLCRILAWGIFWHVAQIDRKFMCWPTITHTFVWKANESVRGAHLASWHRWQLDRATALDESFRCVWKQTTGHCYK